MNVNGGRWTHLARGTAVLLHSRGVHRYKSAFDHAMLESQLSITVGVLYNIHIFTICAQNLLTFTVSGIVWSIFTL